MTSRIEGNKLILKNKDDSTEFEIKTDSTQELFIDELKSNLIYRSALSSEQGSNELSGETIIKSASEVNGREQGTSVSVVDIGDDALIVIGAPQFILGASLGALYTFRSTAGSSFVEDTELNKYSFTSSAYFGTYSTVNEDGTAIITSDLGGTNFVASTTNIFINGVGNGQQLQAIAVKASEKYLMASASSFRIIIYFDSGAGNYAQQQVLQSSQFITGYIEALDISNNGTVCCFVYEQVLHTYTRSGTVWSLLQSTDLSAYSTITGLCLSRNGKILSLCSVNETIVFERPFTGVFLEKHSFAGTGIVDVACNDTMVFAMDSNTISVYNKNSGTWEESINQTTVSGGALSKIACSNNFLVVGQPSLNGIFGQATVYNVNPFLNNSLVKVNKIDLSTDDIVFTTINGEVLIDGDLTVNGTLTNNVSLIGNTFNSGNLLVGDATNLSTGVVMSGDATLSDTGVLSLSDTGVVASGYDCPTIVVGADGRITYAESALKVAMGDGTQGVPSYTFSADADTGIFRPSSNTIGFTTGGVSRMTLSGTLDTTVPISSTDGNATIPAYLFESQLNLGMYYAGFDTIGFGTAGQERMTITNSRTNFQTIQTSFRDGSQTLPSITFGTDLFTGLYKIGANNLGITTGGIKAMDITQDFVVLSGGVSTGNGLSTVSGNGAQAISVGVITYLTNSYWNGTLTQSGDTVETLPTYSNGTYTIKKAGKYYVGYNVIFSTSSNGIREAGIVVNGTTPLVSEFTATTAIHFASSIAVSPLSSSRILDLSVNDTLSIYVIISFGTTPVPMDTSYIGNFTVYRLG